MSDERRTQVFCDREIQGSLMWRAIYYWCFGLFATGFFVFLWSAAVTMTEMSSIGICNELARLFGPAVVGSLVMLPIVVYDVFQQSNAFAGPVYRLRVALRKLAEGEPVTPIRLRDGDMLTDVVEDFNTVLRRIEELEQSAAARFAAGPVAAEAGSAASRDAEPLIALVAEPVLALAADVQQAAHRTDDSCGAYAFPAGTFSDAGSEPAPGGYVG